MKFIHAVRSRLFCLIYAKVIKACEECTPSPCFTPACLRTLLFNAPCKFTPLLNSRTLIFGVTLCGWLRSNTLTTYFDGSIIFDLHPSSWAYTHFSGTQPGRKTRAGSILKRKGAIHFSV